MNQLTLDQLAEQSPVATQELIRLRAELERLRAFKAEVESQEPAVAVPDEWRRIVERAANMMRMSGVVSHKDSLNPLHSWLHDAESLLDAPSHSQQSTHDSEQGGES